MEASTLVLPLTVAASEEIVSVVAHGPLEHGTVDVEEGGRKVARCKLYRNLECSEHQATHEALKQYLKDRRFRIPVEIWIDPEGKELFRYYGWRRPEQFLRDMNEALAKVKGPRLSKAEYRSLVKPLDEAQAALAAERYGEAAAKFEEARRPDAAEIRRDAEAGLGEIRARGEAILRQAKGSLKAGSARKARPNLELLAREFPSFDSGRQAAELLKSLPK
jgi:hypothetical protein